MTSLDHCVRHTFQNCCVPARMNGGHCYVLYERELFHGQSFVKILSLNIFPDIFVADRSSILFGGTKVHSGGMIVLVINNIHLVVPKVLLILFLEFCLPSLKNNNFIISFFHKFFFNFISRFFFQIFV